MQEGSYKMTPEGEVYQTYHLIDSLGNTTSFGSTKGQAEHEAEKINQFLGYSEWFVVPDDPL